MFMYNIYVKCKLYLLQNIKFIYILVHLQILYSTEKQLSFRKIRTVKFITFLYIAISTLNTNQYLSY